jgi:hypothetical protein
MRLLVITLAAAALVGVMVAPAQSFTTCAHTKQGTAVITKLHATTTTCAIATKTARAWARGLQTGTSQQRKCAPPTVKSTATCKVGAYTCRVKAVPTVVAPAELATCTYGPRRVSWRADFS